jgi:hypothetical protein
MLVVTYWHSKILMAGHHVCAIMMSCKHYAHISLSIGTDPVEDAEVWILCQGLIQGGECRGSFPPKLIDFPPLLPA